MLMADGQKVCETRSRVPIGGCPPISGPFPMPLPSLRDELRCRGERSREVIGESKCAGESGRVLISNHCATIVRGRSIGVRRGGLSPGQ